MSFLVHSHSTPKVKFGVDPAPVPLNGEVHIDNLQDLIQRKREIQKNKNKFHLSETDCNLLLTNATEFQYKDQQVIVQEGQELPSVYRIKSGKVNIVKGGATVSCISQGWFLGETLFLNGRSCVYDASLVASGPVTIAELNLPFVKKLFDVDHALALKFYRTLAAKLSSVHYALLGHLLGSCLANAGVEGPTLLAENAIFPIPTLTSAPTTLLRSPSSSSSSSSSSFASSSDGHPGPSSSSSPSPLSSSTPNTSSSSAGSSSNPVASSSSSVLSSSSSSAASPVFPSRSTSSSHIADPSSSSSSSSIHPPSPHISDPSSSSSSAPGASSSSSSSSVPPPSSSSSSANNKPNASITAIGSVVSNAAVLSKCPNLPDSFLLEVINRKKTRTLTKRKSVQSLHAAYKTYKLESNGKGIQAVRLKQAKMNLMSEAFGFKHKNSIEYKKIKNIVKTSDKSVTVVYDPFLGKTLFFKTQEDAEEFYGLATSLVEAGAAEKRKSITGVPISSPTLSISDHPAVADLAESPKEEHDEELKSLILGLATRKEMHKGDYLMEEGDLYQRIYTILSGQVQIVRSGVVLGVVGEGEVIGLPTLLHLRPCPTSLVVSSDTATILMLPAYKVLDVAKNNLPLAARLYKRAAATLQTQIERALRSQRERAAVMAVAEQHEPCSSTQPAERMRDSFSAADSYSSSPTSSPASSPPASPTPLKAPISPALLSA